MQQLLKVQRGILESIHPGRSPPAKERSWYAEHPKTDQKGIINLGRSGDVQGWFMCFEVFVWMFGCSFGGVGLFLFKQKVHDLQWRKITKHKPILNI